MDGLCGGVGWGGEVFVKKWIFCLKEHDWVGLCGGSGGGVDRLCIVGLGGWIVWGVGRGD